MGPWTEQKLECVRKYLRAYTTIMSKQPFRFAYIDAFAGTGYREMESDEDTDELIFPDLLSPEETQFLLPRWFSKERLRSKTSVLRKYVFIEKNINRHTELVRIKKRVFA